MLTQQYRQSAINRLFAHVRVRIGRILRRPDYRDAGPRLKFRLELDKVSDQG